MSAVMDWIFLGLAVLAVAALINMSNRLDRLASSKGTNGTTMPEETLQELLETTRRIEEDISGWLVDQQVVDPENEFDLNGNLRTPRRYR